ncbi:MAG TPA: hypothetical protein VF510_03740, partial [Ktedonobacterales bacterium]
MYTAQTEGEVDVEDAFSEHDIAYWVRDGDRLVPATPTQIAAIQEHETQLRLAAWRAHLSTHPLHINRLRRVGLYLRHTFSLPPVVRSRLLQAQQTAPAADPHPDTPLTETQP